MVDLTAFYSRECRDKKLLCTLWEIKEKMCAQISVDVLSLVIRYEQQCAVPKDLSDIRMPLSDQLFLPFK